MPSVAVTAAENDVHLHAILLCSICMFCNIPGYSQGVNIMLFTMYLSMHVTLS